MIQEQVELEAQVDFPTHTHKKKCDILLFLIFYKYKVTSMDSV